MYIRRSAVEYVNLDGSPNARDIGLIVLSHVCIYDHVEKIGISSHVRQ